MANLKKEVMELISRFDAAQEAFSANSVEIKELRKKHKKDLKAAKAEAKAARIEVEALKAELAILRAGAPAKKESTAKASPASPKKTSAAKRGPGRPKKKSVTAPTVAAAETTTAKPAAKRGPGRPKKSATAAKPAAKAAKKGPGRPKKSATTAKSTAAKGAKKKGPGRPRKAAAVPASPLQAIAGVGPAMAAKFEEAGVKTPAAMAKLSNAKMAAIFAECGPRYRNADSVKMQKYRDAAAAVK